MGPSTARASLCRPALLDQATDRISRGWARVGDRAESSAVQPDDLVVRTSDLMSAPVDQDLVILNTARDNYVALDEIGRGIWERLETPQRVSDLCRGLREEYEGDPDQIAADVLGFLVQLREAGLVRIVDEGPA